MAKDLEVEIKKMLEDYTKDISEAIEKEIEATGERIVEDIKSSTAWQDNTGEYRKGWKIKKEKGKGEIKVTVYNSTRPQLAHLLEFGHAKVGGGRTSPRPHIRPAEKKNIEEMEKNIENIIKRGG